MPKVRPRGIDVKMLTIKLSTSMVESCRVRTQVLGSPIMDWRCSPVRSSRIHLRSEDVGMIGVTYEKVLVPSQRRMFQGGE